MREERLMIRPFEDLQILEYQQLQQVNEHARAKLKGRIPFGRKEDYIKVGSHETWGQIVALAGETETALFHGVLEEMELEIKDGTCLVSLSLCSGTRLMDEKEHTRSFQNEDLTYRDLLNTCGQGYADYGKIMTEAKEKAIGHFIMQYKETDWEFIKRLASKNHVSVFADCSVKGENYHFGIPDRKGEPADFSGEYRTLCDMQEYWNKKERGLSIHPEETTSYIWESREIHKLGERLTADGRELFIWKIESCLKGNELYHACYMKPRGGFQEPEYHNRRVIGVSLSGSVSKVKDERVQVKIAGDENQSNAGACWYPFSTVYSSPDGTGWYCMPEPGDTIRLYFPTEKEENAYVSSAVHGDGAGLRTHPERKFWRNKEGKEIQLSPNQILLTNNEGTYIKLSDDDGIEIVSDGSISMRASGTLSIASSDSSIELSAPKKIRLKQGDTEINLGGDLRMQGTKVRL